MIGNDVGTGDLRLAIFDALEQRSYLTIQELANQLDSGTPTTQARIRDILRSDPEVFWQDEEHWDLSIFHHYFEGRSRLFRLHRGKTFDQEKFLSVVISEALRLKGVPIDVKSLAEKYLLKVSKLANIRTDEFPRGSGKIVKLLRASNRMKSQEPRTD
jgi:hypothetical protein